MTLRMHHLGLQQRAFGHGSARWPLAARMLAASPVLATLLASGCTAPVSPNIMLTFEGPGGVTCEASAPHDIRLMCDSVARVRILDPRGVRDLVPAVCQEISAQETGTMEALGQLQLDFDALPLGPAMVQVEVWRSDWIDPASCTLTGAPGATEPGDQSAAKPAVVGRTWFEIGRDADVRVPMTCPDLGQVNRFAAGCGLDVELSDLDRGVKLRQDVAWPAPDRDDEKLLAPGSRFRPAATSPGAIDLQALDVQYVLIEEAASGGWRPGASEWMTLDHRDDGSAVWRAWPSPQFWHGFTRSRTLCIEVNQRSDDGAPGWPQMSCFQADAEAEPGQRLQASYLPPADLQCLLDASSAGGVPSNGIVIGRVVEPAEQRRDEVQPAANVRVLPTPADLPWAPLPRLAPFGDADGLDGLDGPDTRDGEDDVQYVSKESEPSVAAQVCHVDNATATTPSGYFLSGASFPAHWQFTTGADPPTSEDARDREPAQPRTGSSDVPGRIVVGGRIPDKVSIIRIQLQ